MPWFKNVIIYQLKNRMAFNKAELEKALANYAFKACGNHSDSKLSWISPYGDDQTDLVFDIEHHLLLKANKETKLLPSYVVNQALQLKVTKLETIEKRKLSKEEKRSLKEQVIADLLPRAFSKHQHYFVWIDLKNEQIIVDSASHKQAEDIINLLRRCIGQLAVERRSYQIALELLLTKWVKYDHRFPPLCLGDEAELKDPLDGLGIIRCKQQALVCDEISHHLSAGKRVTKLKLIEEGSISFILQHDFTIKRIKYHLSLLDKSENIDKIEVEKKLAADFMLMTNVILNVLSKINEIVNTLSVK